MVYQQKLVAVIKHNGKILREKDDNIVYLPFLAEYEIFIKNLEARDVVINIDIDGEDILDNQSIIIKANSSISLEGFIKGNKVSNRFRFIQKTGKIQDNRQDRIDDGLIRIEYRFTKFVHPIVTTTQHINQVYWYHPEWCQCPNCRPLQQIIPSPMYYPGWTTSPFISHTGVVSANSYMMSAGVSNYSASIPQQSEGITVKGSESNQQLTQAKTTQLDDQSYTIVLKLRGVSNDQPVVKPVLVSTKVKCSTCGRQSKSHIKYCPECGTALF